MAKKKTVKKAVKKIIKKAKKIPWVSIDERPSRKIFECKTKSVTVYFDPDSMDRLTIRGGNENSLYALYLSHVSATPSEICYIADQLRKHGYGVAD